MLRRVATTIVIVFALVGVVSLWVGVRVVYEDWRFLHTARLLAEQQAQQQRRAPAPAPAPAPAQKPSEPPREGP